jgi:hypothetical protein
VSAPLGNSELYEFDKQSKFVDEQTNLYFGNRLLKLPGSDGDLVFRISALPPPVKDITEPARLTSAEDFSITQKIVVDGKPSVNNLEFVPCVAQARLEVDLKSSLSWANSALKADVAAIGEGGSQLPPISIAMSK